MYLDGAGALAQVADSTFHGNVAQGTPLAEGHGGAIIVGTGASLTVVDSSFISDGANGRGGAIIVSQGATATLSTQNVAHTTNFQGNSVFDSGGAIYSEGALVINDVNLIGNKGPTGTLLAGFGGAVESLGSLTLYDSSFLANEGRFGGALYVGVGVRTCNIRVSIRIKPGYMAVGSLPTTLAPS
jgi:predicted outer membrane repeat protein